jgi:hypothetical protein
MTLALLTLAINLWAFRIEIRNVTINAGIIDAILQEVDRIRCAHGLNTNEEALQEDAPMAKMENRPVDTRITPS